jgi:diadenosine tetraphosphatase ApaH/serine/threonine PP2A family protein phosphatase
MADIHGNLEALDACLEHARARGAERFAFLGDLVGYGADPRAVVEIAMGLADRGVAVKGNHDEAVEARSSYLNDSAREAIEWTRGVLGEEHRRYLARLPLIVREERCALVHASALAPDRWRYVDSPDEAMRSVQESGAPYTFCGHVHDQVLYFERAPGRMGTLRPTPGRRIPIGSHRRWLAIVGSVGQARDGNPDAAYALFDSGRETLTFHRVPYDYHEAARKITAAGLPASLAYRMERGI